MNDEGFIECEVCNGQGYWMGMVGGTRITQPCPRCLGDGKMTWLQKIFGTKHKWEDYKFNGKNWVPARRY